METQTISQCVHCGKEIIRQPNGAWHQTTDSTDGLAQYCYADFVSGSKLHEPMDLLKPPAHEVKWAGYHWVRPIDSDRRRGNLQVLQWQPGVQKWCHSDRIATGQELTLYTKDWEYVCPCPIPDLESNTERLSSREFKSQCTELLTRILGNPESIGIILRPKDREALIEVLRIWSYPI